MFSSEPVREIARLQCNVVAGAELFENMVKMTKHMEKNDKSLLAMQQSYRDVVGPVPTVVDESSDQESELKYPRRKLHFCVCGHANKNYQAFAKHAQTCGVYADWPQAELSTKV